MDDKFYIKGNGFSIRIHEPETDLFTFNNPNPHWKDLGEIWLKVALDMEYLRKLNDKWIDVAYLPSSHIGIIRGNKEDNVLPTKSDIAEFPKATNFVIMTKNGLFRIQGRYLGCEGGFTGAKNNVEFDPIKDYDLILKLLQIAKKIHSPQDNNKTPSL